MKLNAKNNVRTDANAEEAARPTPHIFGQSTPICTVLQETSKIEFLQNENHSVHVLKKQYINCKDQNHSSNSKNYFPFT